MSDVEERLAYLEGRFEEQIMTINNIHDGIARLDGRFDRMEQRLDRRFDKIDERFDRMDTKFGWLVGLMVAMLIATIAALLKH